MSRRYRRTVSFKRSNVERTRTTPESKIRKQLKAINKQVSELEKFERLDSNSKNLLVNRLKESGISYSKGKGFNLSIPKTLEPRQLKAVNKAIEMFKDSESSTVKGLKIQVARQREHLVEIFEDRAAVNRLSDEDVYNLNKVWGSHDYENLRDVLGSKDTETVILKAISEKTGKINFRRKIDMLMEQEADKNLKKSIYNIYKEFIKVNQ